MQHQIRTLGLCISKCMNFSDLEVSWYEEIQFHYLSTIINWGCWFGGHLKCLGKFDYPKISHWHDCWSWSVIWESSSIHCICYLVIDNMIVLLQKGTVTLWWLCAILHILHSYSGSVWCKHGSQEAGTNNTSVEETDYSSGGGETVLERCNEGCRKYSKVE